MSGGVDSSVAAHLLLEQGHDVIGVFMRHGEQSPAACGGGDADCDRLDHKQGCCTASDAEDARRVADKLGIPFYALNLQAEFVQIIDYFVTSTRRGARRIPACSATTGSSSASCLTMRIASAPSSSRRGITRGWRRSADGSDGAAPRRRCGEGSVVRAVRNSTRVAAADDVAGGRFREAGDSADGGRHRLRVADKKDSQEICFVTRGRYDEFVRSRGVGGRTAGELVTTDGTVVGEHDGIEGFTVGQRKGLGVALGDRKFVVRIEPESKRVVIGDRDELESVRADRYQMQLAGERCGKLRRRTATLLRADSIQRSGPTCRDDRARRWSFARTVR